MLASTFAAHGDHTSPTSFLAGFTPAMWLGVALTSTGVLVTLALPVPPRPRAHQLRLPAWIGRLRSLYADLRSAWREGAALPPDLALRDYPIARR
jgi:hypothetical protein